MTPRQLLREMTSYEISEYQAVAVMRREEEQRELDEMRNTMSAR